MTNCNFTSIESVQKSLISTLIRWLSKTLFNHCSPSEHILSLWIHYIALSTSYTSFAHEPLEKSSYAYSHVMYVMAPLPQYEHTCLPVLRPFPWRRPRGRQGPWGWGRDPSWALSRPAGSLHSATRWSQEWILSSAKHIGCSNLQKKTLVN